MDLGPERIKSPADTLPARVVLYVEWPNRAFREYTAVSPLEYQFAVAPSDGRPQSEPKLMVMFAGNPELGGIQVAQEGRPPEA
jgi:hypothetical protein